MTIYEGLSRRKKKYVVADRTEDITIVDFAKRLYHCKAEDVKVTSGWVHNGLLYLEDPHKRGQQSVLVAFHIGR